MAGEGVGAVLGGTYRIERLIGGGGMGQVYEASHVRLPRRFAVKILSPEIAYKPAHVERFRREAEIASGLGHDNIVQVFDFNTSERGTAYMVMELLDGEDLRRHLDREGHLSVDETIDIVGQVASAVAAAHARGIVHRDLKPQNVFLCKKGGKTTVKVLDFGVSKILDSDTLASTTSVLLGTPHYMAPEQASGDGRPVDQRADVFALGAIAYECLTGELAFTGPTPVGVLYSVVHNAPVPLRRLRSDVKEELARVIDKAMSKEPDARPANAAAFRRELLAACGLFVADTQPSEPRAIPGGLGVPADDVRIVNSSASDAPTLSQASLSAVTPVTTAKRAPRSRLWLALGAAVLAVVAFVVFGARSPSEPGPQPAPAAAVATEHRVQIALSISPPDARVELDGVATQENPLRLPYADRAHELTVSARGYVTARRSFRALTAGTVRVELERQAPPVAPSPSIVKPTAPRPPVRAPAPAPASTAPKPKPPPVGPVERSL